MVRDPQHVASSLQTSLAVKLVAAFEWAGVLAAGTLVSFDERLKAAARREGFNPREG